MAFCEPRVELGLVPQVDLETLQPEGQAEARMESNSEGASPGPCTVQLNAMKKVEKVEPSSEESQDMKALQKKLEQFANLLKLGVHPGRCGAHPGRSLCKGVQPDRHLPL